VCAAASVVARADVTVYTQWPFDAQEAARRQVETAKALNQPAHITLDLGGTPLDLALIPAGRFAMGSPETETIDIPTPGSRRANESPQHEVVITQPFYMAIYKITQAQYQRVMGSNPSRFVDDTNPVDAVTWKDTALFCEKASVLASPVCDSLSPSPTR
jgi:formylglycine-generating enzyme required for sulfatase activity